MAILANFQILFCIPCSEVDMEKIQAINGYTRHMSFQF